MSVYTDPDGNKYNIPTDPEQREYFAKAIQAAYPGEDIDQTTILGQAAETLKGIPRGAVGLALDVPLGIASLFDIGNDSDFVQGLSQYKDFLNTESSLAADPAYRDKWLTKLGEGAGSFIPFLGAAKIGQLMRARGIGRQVTRDPRTWMRDPMYTVPAALAVPSGISQQADRISAARALGEDVGGVAETFAELGGGIVGLSEILPIFNILKRVPKNALKYSDIRRKIESALRAGGQEGLQEVSASFAQNLIARGLYSDELPLVDSLFDEFTIGGVVGALADFGVNAISGRGKGRQYLYDREERARNNIISLHEEHKFQKAQAQGLVEEITDLPDVVIPDIPLPAIVAPGPQLEVIQDASGGFSVVDLQNQETPILKSFDKEVKAISFKNKQETNYERKKLKVDLDNAMYALGLPESGTAQTIGSTINDVNSSSVNLQSIVNFDTKLTKDQKDILQKEKIAAGFRSVRKGEDIVYSEMVGNKKEARLKEIRKYIESKRTRAYKDLSYKASYTMPEAKHILSPKDYNALLEDMASTVFQASKKAGEPALTKKESKTKDGKPQYNVSNKYIKDLAASKNINLDFDSLAVQYAVKQWTGFEGEWKKATRPVKELFLARIHSLPKFNFQTLFPDFRPRKYTALDVANFVATRGSQNIKFNSNDLLQDGVTAKDKKATEQFINDLVFSGRAEKIKGTSQYQIRPNHQFDIARKAEGFNETPQEFGDKLRAENKLPEEIIESLVEKERQRQSKVLPPQEIDKKVVNFKEAVEEGRTNKFAKELKKILDKRGIESGLVVSNDILSTTNLVQTKGGEIKFDPRATRATPELGAKKGQYDRETDIIFLSLNAVNPDGKASDEQISDRLSQVLDREMIHAFRNKDLIDEPEYQYLRKEVKRRKVPETYDSRYKGRTFYQRAMAKNQNRSDLLDNTDQRREELYVEEAIAEMFRARTHRPDITPKSKGILNKIAEFFQAMGRAMRISGFKRVSNIFNEIESGAVGARERGKIRTLRELDRLPPQLMDAPIAQEFEEGEGEAEVYNAEELGEGAIGTPAITFKDVEADTDPITGVILTPSGLGRSDIFKLRERTFEQLSSDRDALLEEFGYERHDTLDAINALIKMNPGKDYKFLLERLKTQIAKFKRIGKMDVGFQIIKKGRQRLDEHVGKVTKTWMGVSHYSSFSNVAQIYIQNIENLGSILVKNNDGEAVQWKQNGVNFETIVHELVHQATQIAVDLSGMSEDIRINVQELEKIRNRVRVEFNKRTKEELSEYDLHDRENIEYGFSNVHELLAVGFTDRAFQKFMESIPYAVKGKQSIWDKFTETIRKLLSIPAKQATLFSEFLSQAGKITSISQKQISSLMFGEGKPKDITVATESIINKPKLIQDRIDVLEVRLMPLESTMRKEGGTMIRKNHDILYNEIYRIKSEIWKLENELKAAEEINVTPSGIPKQLTMFSRSTPAYREALDDPATRNRIAKELEDAGIGGEFGIQLYEITDNDLASFSQEGKRLINALKKDDWLGFDNVDDLMLAIFDENIDEYNPSLATKRAIGRYVNLNYGGAGLTMFSRGNRFASDNNTTANKKLVEATEKAVEFTKRTPRGEVPYYNVNASDVALEAAINFNEDVTAKVPPKDITNYSRGALPTELADDIIRTGYKPGETKSLGATLLDTINNPIESVRARFKDFRQNYVDYLDKTNQKILAGKTTAWYMGVDKEGRRRKNPLTNKPWTLAEAEVASEEVRLANNSADAGTVQAMRLAEKARGIFRQMLTVGYVTSEIFDERLDKHLSGITNVLELEIDTKYNPFIDGDTGTGGLMQIMSVLYADPTVDLEAVFGYYAKIMRIKTMEDNGRVIDSPITEKDKEQLNLIRRKYPSVVEAYNNYQKWNNKLIKFAEDKGLLNAEQSAMWREHSSYYPFYRDMVDEEGLAAPTIGGGLLPSNPLNIKMKGSKEEIRVNPIEAIARNSLSILTAAMKNDGTSKLLRDLQTMGEAKQVTALEKERGNLNTIFVFEDGNKQRYEVDDVELFHGIQAIGGVKTDAVTRFLAIPSSILRDTVTRDPGFIIVNLLRDTLSAAVTSGAPLSASLGGEAFTPIISTVRNMFSDMSKLEKFGIIGGYDFQNDEGSIVQLMERARRQQGLSPDNGISVKDGFFKAWDGLGALTTKSDGATRLAVYNAVYNDMKDRGANEAQAQSEAAYQALEIINFGRRGLSPMFRMITAAIPFFNARIQGLDVLYRSAAGKYSAIDKLEAGETIDDVKNRIQRKFLLRASTMIAITALYYLMMSDTDEYKAVKREVRDDNWIFPNFLFPGVPIKIPIPFEVGILFKAIPERLFDMMSGEDAVEKAPWESIKRQLQNTIDFPFLSGDVGIQAVKPLFEALINRNSFTDTNIVPYYKLKGEPAYQARQSTNEVARLLGEAMNISPAKIEHVLTGYTGTLGGYVLSILDVAARSMTGTPIMPPSLNDIPVIKRLFFDLDKSGGLQQSFYELREVVDGAVLTLNDLRKQRRFDELAAFREHNKGVFQVKGQMRAIERYMDNWRRRRDNLLRRGDISPIAKSDMLREMELDRDRRLAIIPALRQKANVPAISLFN